MSGSDVFARNTGLYAQRNERTWRVQLARIYYRHLIREVKRYRWATFSICYRIPRLLTAKSLFLFRSQISLNDLIYIETTIFFVKRFFPFNVAKFASSFYRFQVFDSNFIDPLRLLIDSSLGLLLDVFAYVWRTIYIIITVLTFSLFSREVHIIIVFRKRGSEAKFLIWITYATFSSEARVYLFALHRL